MIPYERTRQQTIPNSSVKIIGVGGAGANMLDRVAIDGMDGAELLVANTDLRTLTSSVSAEKIQLGRALTKGLGSGGDPDLGRQAALEAELEIRDTLRDRKIVFICVGLGGGTGSGAAPLIARLAREEGAFTVVFATMPFGFEGKRRREQAGTALNELAVLANALVTFDNGRMGDLILAKQGVHEAFAAADRMISEAIKAVTRIVLRPGLVNIGLDDLVAALSSNRSRCLFGSGIAEGENRAQQALKNALLSPLLDRGSLLAQAQTVLVHICGGEDLTLYEIELLMRGLGKHVPETAQMLFGTAVDPAMKDSLSVTLVSSLPEEALQEGISAESAGGPSSRAKAPTSVEDLDEDFVGLDTVGKSEGEEPRTQLPPPAKIKGKSGIEKITIAVPPRKHRLRRSFPRWRNCRRRRSRWPRSLRKPRLRWWKPRLPRRKRRVPPLRSAGQPRPGSLRWRVGCRTLHAA
jgi:cell division protein FtsZ